MKNYNYQHQFLYAIAGTIAYCIPTGIYLRAIDSYPGLYLLYVGNFLFTIILSIALIFHNLKRGNRERLGSIFGFGVKVTFLSIVLSFVAVALVFLLGGNKTGLLQSPAVMGVNTNKSLRAVVFLDATIVNLFLGLFASLMISVSLKYTTGNPPGQQSN